MAERPGIEPWLWLIRLKCKDVARHYRAFVEPEDLISEVAVWWYSTNPETLAKYVADEKPHRLRRALWRVARDVAEREKRHRRPTERFVQVRYAPRQVMDLLPVALDPEGLPDGGGVQEGSRPKGNLAESGDLLASMIDVRRALSTLSNDDIATLHLVAGLHWDYDKAGPAFGIEPDSARRKVARIAQRLTNWLNHDDDPDLGHEAKAV